eukprot:1919030-Rhodomonas_salina.4
MDPRWVIDSEAALTRVPGCHVYSAALLPVIGETSLLHAYPYGIRLQIPRLGQRCRVSHGTGTVGEGEANSEKHCSPRAHTIVIIRRKPSVLGIQQLCCSDRRCSFLISRGGLAPIQRLLFSRLGLFQVPGDRKTQLLILLGRLGIHRNPKSLQSYCTAPEAHENMVEFFRSPAFQYGNGNLGKPGSRS